MDDVLVKKLNCQHKLTNCPLYSVASVEAPRDWLLGQEEVHAAAARDYCPSAAAAWPSSKVELFARRIYDETLSQYDILCVLPLNLHWCSIRWVGGRWSLCCSWWRGRNVRMCIYSNLSLSFSLSDYYVVWGPREQLLPQGLEFCLFAK